MLMLGIHFGLAGFLDGILVGFGIGILIFGGMTNKITPVIESKLNPKKKPPDKANLSRHHSKAIKSVSVGNFVIGCFCIASASSSWGRGDFRVRNENLEHSLDSLNRINLNGAAQLPAADAGQNSSIHFGLGHFTMHFRRREVASPKSEASIANIFDQSDQLADSQKDRKTLIESLRRPADWSNVSGNSESLRPAEWPNKSGNSYRKKEGTENRITETIRRECRENDSSTEKSKACNDSASEKSEVYTRTTEYILFCLEEELQRENYIYFTGQWRAFARHRKTRKICFSNK